MDINTLNLFHDSTSLKTTYLKFQLFFRLISFLLSKTIYICILLNDIEKQPPLCEVLWPQLFVPILDFSHLISKIMSNLLWWVYRFLVWIQRLHPKFFIQEQWSKVTRRTNEFSSIFNFVKKFFEGLIF